jgi:hypothetical protein
LNKPDDELPIFVDPSKQPKPPDRAPEGVASRPDPVRAAVAKAIERSERIERLGRERSERIERVGRVMYDELWIGELGKREWKIGKDNSADHLPTLTVDLPSSGKEAAKIARARFCSRASDEQFGQVIRWLNDARASDGTRVLDCSVSEFDVWFRKEFPDAPLTSTEKRKATVLALWNSGRRPGRHGNMTWNDFKALVREQSGQQCEDRTIERDVADLAGSGVIGPT